mgnify:CR=1 FL=1|jgi:DNA polymerase III alpha subunit
MHLPDIDIDCADRDKILNLVRGTPARLGTGKKHNTGVYFTGIPTDGSTGMASIDYKTAEDRGYFKFDFLNVSIYEDINDEDELNELIDMDPMWELLEHKEVVEQLFHIANHYDIVKKMKPVSVKQLAAVLAIIRPAKRHLLGKSYKEIYKTVYDKPEDGQYHFKKSHSVGYALAIVVQMNQMVKRASKEFSVQE